MQAIDWLNIAAILAPTNNSPEMLAEYVKAGKLIVVEGNGEDVWCSIKSAKSARKEATLNIHMEEVFRFIKEAATGGIIVSELRASVSFGGASVLKKRDQSVALNSIRQATIRIFGAAPGSPRPSCVNCLPRRVLLKRSSGGVSDSPSSWLDGPLPEIGEYSLFSVFWDRDESA
jgi:hypothetical protein